jgi:hypothetical protein
MTDEQGGLQELAAQVEAGLDPYAVIGRLYVKVLAKDQALALAIGALKQFADQEKPNEVKVVTELPKEAPEGALFAVEVPNDPVVPMVSPDATPGNTFGAKPKRNRSKRG